MINEAIIIGGAVFLGLLIHAVILSPGGHSSPAEQQGKALGRIADNLSRLADNLGRIGILVGKGSKGPKDKS